MNQRITRELSTPERKGMTSEFVSDSGLKVKVTYPDHVPDAVRRQKINRLYDILSGADRKDEAS